MSDSLNSFLSNLESRSEARQELIDWLATADAAIILVRMDTAQGPNGEPGLGLAWGTLNMDAEMGLFLSDLAGAMPGILLRGMRKRSSGEGSDDDLEPPK